MSGTTHAHVAALSIEHGAEVVSYDRHFARFEGSGTASSRRPRRLPPPARRPRRGERRAASPPTPRWTAGVLNGG